MGHLRAMSQLISVVRNVASETETLVPTLVLSIRSYGHLVSFTSSLGFLIKFTKTNMYLQSSGYIKPTAISSHLEDNSRCYICFLDDAECIF
jgi:hypothetical protein